MTRGAGVRGQVFGRRNLIWKLSAFEFGLTDRDQGDRLLAQLGHPHSQALSPEPVDIRCLGERRDPYADMDASGGASGAVRRTTDAAPTPAKRPGVHVRTMTWH